LATLLPITSRLLLELLRPESPCWKPMALSFLLRVVRKALGGWEGDQPTALTLV
jgi:hypothetical protein